MLFLLPRIERVRQRHRWPQDHEVLEKIFRYTNFELKKFYNERNIRFCRGLVHAVFNTILFLNESEIRKYTSMLFLQPKNIDQYTTRIKTIFSMQRWYSTPCCKHRWTAWVAVCLYSKINVDTNVVVFSASFATLVFQIFEKMLSTEEVPGRIFFECKQRTILCLLKWTEWKVSSKDFERPRASKLAKKFFRYQDWRPGSKCTLCIRIM